MHNNNQPLLGGSQLKQKLQQEIDDTRKDTTFFYNQPSDTAFEEFKSLSDVSNTIGNDFLNIKEELGIDLGGQNLSFDA